MDENNGPFRGEVLLSWPVDEYERHERGLLWYVFFGMVGATGLFYALAIQNFLFAVIIIMFAVIIGLSSLRDPRQMDFAVTEVGIGVGHQFFGFKELDSFWILYDEDVKNLYFEFRKSMRPHLVVPLYDIDPLPIRELLLEFLDEDFDDDKEEPLSDFFGRLLKL